MPFFFVNANRERFPITHMFDIDGDEISEPDDAFSLVARLPSGKWLATQCERHQIVYEPPTELSSQDRGT